MQGRSSDFRITASHPPSQAEAQWRLGWWLPGYRFGPSAGLAPASRFSPQGTSQLLAGPNLSPNWHRYVPIRTNGAAGPIPALPSRQMSSRTRKSDRIRIEALEHVQLAMLQRLRAQRDSAKAILAATRASVGPMSESQIVQDRQGGQGGWAVMDSCQRGQTSRSLAMWRNGGVDSSPP
jgi:hypothetical protein